MRFTRGIAPRRRFGRHPIRYWAGAQAALWLGALALIAQMLIWAGATPALARIGGVTQWVCTPSGLERIDSAAADESGEAPAQLLKCPLCPLLAALAEPPPAPDLPRYLPPVGRAELPPMSAQRMPGRHIAAAQARGPPPITTRL